MRCPKCGDWMILVGDSARLRLYQCACGHTAGYRPKIRYIPRALRIKRNRRRYGGGFR